MFTGIIEDLGTVTGLMDSDRKSVWSSGPDARNEVIVKVRPGNDARFDDVVLGESIAVNGVCLTVAETPARGEDLIFYVSPETLSRTQFRSLSVGVKVNLERSLKVSDRLSGHIVQGHVDGVAEIASIDRVGEAYSVKFRLPNELMKYCIEKGSIALNGTSLTINRLDGDAIDIMMIPHTWEHTQFHTARAGDPVNVEVDVLAKYVERLWQQKPV